MQQLRPEERREFQRLQLKAPIPGTFGPTPISIIEIGILGARIRHSQPLDLPSAQLRFKYGRADVTLKCEIVRTFPGIADDSGLESGMRFLAAIADSGNHLRHMLAELVTAELAARRATPEGMMPSRPRAVDGDKTVRGRDAAFLGYRYTNGAWTRRRVFLPEQPSVGFTVARTEDSDEMQRLCNVYEVSDEEGRRLIRLFAELSIGDALQIPPRAS